jgi:xylulokinase
LAGKLNPDMNPQAKGVFFGAGLDHKRRHYVRAILEAMGFMLRENIEMIERTGVVVKEIRSLGGGSKSRLWSTIKADICGRDMVTMNQTEATSLGAAILAFVALGDYRSLEAACAKAVSPKDRYHPDTKRRSVYDMAYQKYLRVYERLRDVF